MTSDCHFFRFILIGRSLAPHPAGFLEQAHTYSYVRPMSLFIPVQKVGDLLCEYQPCIFQ